ncbi:MAG: hypothetical protein ISR64_04720 [Deltaproteobacteria bacterium]|nr:hypothetical protein [Deltaproteobacteria bacterium]
MSRSRQTFLFSGLAVVMAVGCGGSGSGRQGQAASEELAAQIILPGAQGQTSGTLQFDFQIPEDICNDLAGICDEPSCQELLDDCDTPITLSPSCQDLVDNCPSTGSACVDSCVDSVIDCLIANNCTTTQTCIEPYTNCVIGCVGGI